MPSLPDNHAAQALNERPASTVTCLITGADIVTSGFWQHGDLFLVGECYVFNACGEPKYEPHPAPDAARCLLVHDSFHQNYFERRNVYVVPKTEAHLSDGAKRYIGGVR